MDRSSRPRPSAGTAYGGLCAPIRCSSPAGSAFSRFQRLDGRGALFKNDRKAKDVHPDYWGDCMIDGQKYWASGWIRDGKGGGSKYLSLAFRLADEQQPKVDARVRGVAEEEIPF
jgi:hypothetical protein